MMKIQVRMIHKQVRNSPNTRSVASLSAVSQQSDVEIKELIGKIGLSRSLYYNESKK